jgi:hypothetical protein
MLYEQNTVCNTVYVSSALTTGARALAILAPVDPTHGNRKIFHGKEDGARLTERIGPSIVIVTAGRAVPLS